MFSSDDEEIKVIKQRKMAELQKALISKTAMSSIREPITLTDSNFKNELSKYPILLIDFWAPWCGPCKMIAPIIEQLAIEYTGKVVFGKVERQWTLLLVQSLRPRLKLDYIIKELV